MTISEQMKGVVELSTPLSGIERCRQGANRTMQTCRATVGQLDKSALFYLRTRGLDEDEATQALTRAFASAILGKLAIAECHEYLASAMNKQIDALIDEE